MNTGNPYKSPRAAGSAPGDRPMNVPVRVGLSALLALPGILFLLLLNGQVFTNALVFLALWTASLAVWAPAAIRRRAGRRRRLAVYVILGHLAFMLAIGVSLPRRYRWQKAFNAKACPAPNRADSPPP